MQSQFLPLRPVQHKSDGRPALPRPGPIQSARL